CDDAAAPPDLGDLVQVEVISVAFRISQRGRLSIDGVFPRTDVGAVKNAHALSEGRHQSVLDSVVYHFDKVPRAARPAVQISLFRRSSLFRSSCRTGNFSETGRQRRKNGIEMLHCPRFAADHQAVTALPPPDSAARADIHIMNTLRRQFP